MSLKLSTALAAGLVVASAAPQAQARNEESVNPFELEETSSLPGRSNHDQFRVWHHESDKVIIDRELTEQVLMVRSLMRCGKDPVTESTVCGEELDYDFDHLADRKPGFNRNSFRETQALIKRSKFNEQERKTFNEQVRRIVNKIKGVLRFSIVGRSNAEQRGRDPIHYSEHDVLEKAKR